MKSTPNKQFTETQSTVSILKDCLKFPPQGGFDFPTMRSRNKIADVLDKVTAGGVIELEDADHAAAVEAIKNTRWNVVDKHLLDFAEQFGL